MKWAGWAKTSRGGPQDMRSDRSPCADWKRACPGVTQPRHRSRNGRADEGERDFEVLPTASICARLTFDAVNSSSYRRRRQAGNRRRAPCRAAGDRPRPRKAVPGELRAHAGRFPGYGRDRRAGRRRHRSRCAQGPRSRTPRSTRGSGVCSRVRQASSAAPSSFTRPFKWASASAASRSRPRARYRPRRTPRRAAARAPPATRPSR